MALFEYRSRLKGSVERAFELLSKPEFILKVTPPDMGLSYVNPPAQYAKDAIIEFKVIQFGMVQNITHKITEFDAPRKFVEEMIKGPMPKWIHTHEFIDLGNGEIELVDKIDFDTPGGLLAFVVTESKIKQQLEIGMDLRHTRLEKMM
jgi:ligand-binding SRPBCC domain-containing protein